MTEETKDKRNPFAVLPPNERIIVVAAILVSVAAMLIGLFVDLDKESVFALLNKIGRALLLLTRS